MKVSAVLSLLILVLVLAGVAGARAAESKEYIVYVGTMGKAIYSFRLDAATGKMTPLGIAAESVRPAFVELAPGGKNLYCVGETRDGVICSFAVDPKTGKLTSLNKVSSKGNGPAHVNVDKTGQCVLAANYGSGSLASFPVKPDGSLGEAVSVIQNTGSSVNPKRQEGPHAHSFTLSPDNRFALACDLGLDKIFIFKLDPAKATLTPNDPPFAAAHPGAGPRHMVFHPNGKFVYVINELQSSITAYAWDAEKGVMTELQTVSALPPDFKGENTCAEVRVHPNGKFLYGSCRGHDSIVFCRIDEATGKITPTGWALTQGKTPRNFNIDPTGKWLIAANQATGNLVVFALAESDGAPVDTGQRFEVPMPSCIRFLKAE